MAKYFVKSNKMGKYLVIAGESLKQTKYAWTEKIEEATNFRYQVTAFKQLGMLRSTRSRSYGELVVLKEEYSGKIFEVANFEIEV